mgnify:CR=1 FL=1
MIQTMKSLKRVSFEDCDPFAHLNNANYLNYFLNARETQLRKNKVLNIFDHAKQTGKSWAVASHDIRYIKPAHLGEQVEIWSRMLTYESFVNLVEFIMISPEKRQVKAVMHTRFAYFTIDTSKPTAPEDQIRTLFNQICLFPGEKISSFSIKDRMKHIKKEIQLPN